MAETKAKIEILNLLTQKQIDVLELLTKHSTSKEISKALGISPHTVYQRIETAKRRLGVTGRRDLIQAYLSHKRVCEQFAYEKFHMAMPLPPKQELCKGNGEDPVMFADQVRSDSSYLIETPPVNRVVPPELEGSTGTLYRLALIFAISTLMIFIILAIVTIFAEVNTMSSVRF